MRRAQLRAILFLVSFWVLSALFSTAWEGAIRGFEAPDSAVALPYSFPQELVIILVVTLVAGTAIACFDVLFLSRVLRRFPLGLTLLAKTSFYLACITIVISMAVLVIRARWQNQPILDRSVLDALAFYWSTPESIATVAFWGAAVLFGLFVVQVGEKFGQGVLISFLLGRYHQPKEEDRIFIFMDLKSSTTYAERLGHVKYSQLIQDCFFDLTDVVVRHNAVIYQYVGDEVVLTWRIKTARADGNCIRVFYAYDEAIRRRRAHYEARYGFVPEFKAAVHAGRVTVAEVGEVKKDLAFHGDVLNTAARIQGKCNELGCRLLVSEQVRGLMADVEGYDFEFEGNVDLKGKARPVKVFSASLNPALQDASV